MPPVPDPVLRLLHVSDLHVGPLDARGLPHAPALYLREPFSGWLGHDPLATRALARFLRQLRRDGAPVYVVTTGDLTAWGDPAQFAKAEAYLGATVLDGPSRIGLREPGWLDRAVPGNHDHWGGAGFGGTPWAFPQMMRPPTPSFHRLFGPLPQKGTPPLAVPGLPSVRFVRLDTDADVRPYSRDRFFARGSFRSHLSRLDTDLPPKAEGEVRVVLAHHCRDYRGTPRNGYRVEVDPQTRTDFDAFLVRHEADVLLSGHTHEVGISTPTVRSPAGTRTLLYARCGTSTGANPRDERFKRAAGWSALDALPLAKRAERSVVLHELARSPGGPVWKAAAYRLNRRNRFEPWPRWQASHRV